MPRYFFHLRAPGTLPGRLDREGVVLPDLREARSEMLALAGETLKDLARQKWQGQALWVEVADEQGVTLCSMAISVISKRTS